MVIRRIIKNSFSLKKYINAFILLFEREPVIELKGYLRNINSSELTACEYAEVDASKTNKRCIFLVGEKEPFCIPEGSTAIVLYK